MENTKSVPALLLEVRTAKGNKLIVISQILYIQSCNKHCFIYFANGGPPLETHALLKWFEEELPAGSFCRCHDSYIVNCAFIDCICGSKFVLTNNTYIPVSRGRKDYSRMAVEWFILEKQIAPK